MIKIAITGNIASGKTQIENILKEMGYKVFDTDEIAHKILESSENVINAFKDFDILESGKISRKKLGNIVFNNKNLRQKLESIIHPLVREEILGLFDEYKDEKYVFISIPLLFESKMEDLFDKIILVYCNDTVRIERLMARNNLTEHEARARMDSQLSQDEKVKYADYVLKNESTIDELKKQINNLF